MKLCYKKCQNCIHLKYIEDVWILFGGMKLVSISYPDQTITDLSSQNRTRKKFLWTSILVTKRIYFRRNFCPAQILAKLSLVRVMEIYYTRVRFADNSHKMVDFLTSSLEFLKIVCNKAYTIIHLFNHLTFLNFYFFL